MEYGRKLTGALDRQLLGQLLTVELPRVLQVERAALLLPEVHQLVAIEGMACGCRSATPLCVGWLRVAKRKEPTGAGCAS